MYNFENFHEWMAIFGVLIILGSISYYMFSALIICINSLRIRRQELKKMTELEKWARKITKKGI